MDADYKRFTAFLTGMGIKEVPHTQKSYLGHLIAGGPGLVEPAEDEGLDQGTSGEDASALDDAERAGQLVGLLGQEGLQGGRQLGNLDHGEGLVFGFQGVQQL